MATWLPASEVETPPRMSTSDLRTLVFTGSQGIHTRFATPRQLPYSTPYR